MTDIFGPETIPISIAGGSVFTFALLYIAKFFNGLNSEEKQLIQTQSRRLEIKEKDLVDAQSIIKQKQVEIDNLTAKLREKETEILVHLAKIKELQDTIALRDPALMETLENLERQMSEIVTNIVELKKELLIAKVIGTDTQSLHV